MLEDAIKTVEDLQSRGIQLRIMGAIAFRIHCPQKGELFEKLDRPLTDIDFMASARDSTKIMNYFESIGHKLIFGLTGDRKIFQRPDGMKVDVFLDKLSMCHMIDFERRLGLDYPTVPLAEMTLEKVQIVKITEKDLKDLSILFLEHEVGKTDDDVINGAHIAKLLAKDWGFWYTTTTNLEKLKDYAEYLAALSMGEKETVSRRISLLREMIEKEPKSMSWKMRAMSGTRTKWYRDVEDS